MQWKQARKKAPIGSCLAKYCHTFFSLVGSLRREYIGHERKRQATPKTFDSTWNANTTRPSNFCCTINTHTYIMKERQKAHTYARKAPIIFVYHFVWYWLAGLLYVFSEVFVPCILILSFFVLALSSPLFCSQYLFWRYSLWIFDAIRVWILDVVPYRKKSYLIT